MHKCVNNSTANLYHLEQFVSDFFPYSQKQLGFDKPATIRFESDQDNAGVMLGKTAYYDPDAMEVVLYTDGRHPKDVMRSLSHELVHHAQNCRGDFTAHDNTGPGYAQEDPHLRKMEREAYTKGNLIFRDFEDLIKTGKINIEIDFSDSGEPKMSLKEWKNNEINTKLMKKWGFLKESVEKLYEDCPEHGPECEGCDSQLEENTEGEETYDYGEAEGHDEKELHDLIKRHATRSHIDALKSDMGYDRRHQVRGEEGTDFHETTDLEGLRSQAGGEGDERYQYSVGDAAKKGGKLDAPSAGGQMLPREGARAKISVREAKEMTRRILTRVRKEGK